MKNYKKYNVGDQVIIVHTHNDDLNKIGIITEVRHSFCKIDIDGKLYNHTYGQFKLVNNE